MIHVFVAPLLLREFVFGLQRTEPRVEQVVFYVGTHPLAEDHCRVVTAVGIERRQHVVRSYVTAVEIAHRLRIAFGVVGRDHYDVVVEERRVVDIVEASPARGAEHRVGRALGAALRDGRVGRGERSEDAVDVDLRVGQHDEEARSLVLQYVGHVAHRRCGRVARREYRTLVVERIGVARIVASLQQRQHLLLELLVVRRGVYQINVAAAVDEIGYLVVFLLGVGRQLVENRTVHRRDIRERRDHGHRVVSGELHHGIQLVLVNGSHDEIGAREGLVGHYLLHLEAVVLGVVDRKVDIAFALRFQILQSQQETLVELHIAGVGFRIDAERQHEGHIERLPRRHGAEHDVLVARERIRLEALIGDIDAALLRRRAVGIGNADHRARLESLGHVVQLGELGLGDAVSARERIDGLPGLHHMIFVTVVGGLVEIVGVFGHLVLSLLLRRGAYLGLADPQRVADGQALRIDRGVVLAKSRHRDVVVARDGVKGFARLDLVRQKLAFAFAFGARVGFHLLGNGNFDRLVDPQSVGDIGVMLLYHLLVHLVSLGYRVEGFARFDGVDIIFLAVDEDDHGSLLYRGRILGRNGERHGEYRSRRNDSL